MLKAYKGHIVFTKKPEAFTIIENGYIVVENDHVKALTVEKPENMDESQITDYGDRLILPGFVDLHFHAPQYLNIGLGLDKELLPWLNEYIFPTEAMFKDTTFASQVYKHVANALLRQGTTRAVIFSTVHLESSKILARALDASGIGAYVGKVNMDRNATTDLMENTQSSLADTEAFIKSFSTVSNRVQPIITPRFVPTCTEELLSGLGKLARAYDLPVQSHISENEEEVKWVQSLHPEHPDYASVYEHNGLFNEKTIMAHCVYLTENEIRRMSEKGVYAAHCPNANYNLASGMMSSRKLIDAGVAVGLGSDVGAGHQVGMYKVMAQAIQASKMVWRLIDNTLSPLTVSEAFYMGTKGGGAFFGKVGSFEPGYKFDALVIDDTLEHFGLKRTINERLEQFIYCGDDRQIIDRYVDGNRISI